MSPRAALAAIALAGAAAALGGCPAKDDASFGATTLVQADGVYQPPAGATLEVTRATVAGLSMPAEAVVRLAIARDVMWADVETLVATLEGNHKQAVALVGRRYHTRAIKLHDELRNTPIQVLTFLDGKACVRGPGEVAAKCVQSPGNDYVEKAFVRQLVREARDVFNLSDVEVEVPGSLKWSDVVNALDGARTCCGDVEVRVNLRTSVDDGTVLVPTE